jgi:hypothetical protein
MSGKQPKQATETLCGHSRPSMACTSGTRGQYPRRMVNKARLLTRPPLARRDAPCPKQGRSSTADPRFTFHVLPCTVLESEASTPLAELFSILLTGETVPAAIGAADCTPSTGGRDGRRCSLVSPAPIRSTTHTIACGGGPHRKRNRAFSGEHDHRD